MINKIKPLRRSLMLQSQWEEVQLEDQCVARPNLEEEVAVHPKEHLLFQAKEHLLYLKAKGHLQEIKRQTRCKIRLMTQKKIER